MKKILVLSAIVFISLAKVSHADTLGSPFLYSLGVNVWDRSDETNYIAVHNAPIECAVEYLGRTVKFSGLTNQGGFNWVTTFNNTRNVSPIKATCSVTYVNDDGITVKKSGYSEQKVWGGPFTFQNMWIYFPR